jgi:hypothetical protein
MESNPIQITQSAPMMEFRDDTVVINAENNELSDMDTETEASETPKLVPSKELAGSAKKQLDTDLPCTSSSVSNSALQERPTVKAIAPKIIPIETSRFISMQLKGSYTFPIFHRRVMKFVPEFNNVVYFEREESARAYFEFKEVRTAAKFKKLMEKLDKGQEVTIKYAEEKAIRVIDKVKSKERHPKQDDEVIYHINEEKQIFIRRVGENFKVFTLPSPDHVANSSRQI